MTFRYVTHDRVRDYLNTGWHIAAADMGHHGYYSVLMTWLCECKQVEPV